MTNARCDELLQTISTVIRLAEGGIDASREGEVEVERIIRKNLQKWGWYCLQLPRALSDALELHNNITGFHGRKELFVRNGSLQI